MLIYLTTAVGLYLAICVYFYVRQDTLIFYPGSVPETTPEAFGRSFRALSIPTADGERLDAWLIDPRGDLARATAATPRKVVLYSHGNAGNIAHRLDVAGTFADLGLAVLLYDYRGYGRSTGRASEQGVYADALAVWDHLVQHEGFAPETIVLFGESLGGAVSIELATQKTVGAVIVEDTFTSIANMGAELYPWLPIRWLARTRFDSLAKIDRIQAPLLVIHSPEDRLVPVGHGRALLAAAREPKALLLTGGNHNDGGFRLRAEWIDEVRRFLTALG